MNSRHRVIVMSNQLYGYTSNYGAAAAAASKSPTSVYTSRSLTDYDPDQSLYPYSHADMLRYSSQTWPPGVDPSSAIKRSSEGSILFPTLSYPAFLLHVVHLGLFLVALRVWAMIFCA